MKLKKEIAFLVLTIFFAILTFCGAGYVLANKGQVNAGYAVIPCLFTLSFLSALRQTKNNDKK